ncbi:MAG: CotH kinase family protein [Oscillospiraceae bacterium]|nr:CotH kinase family protein [Oscillospiraceae bacterium]
MRRGIIAMTGMAVCVLLLSVFFQDLGGQAGVLRYQQHREQPSEEALGPCGACGGAGTLCTHLPIIHIETGGQTIPGRPYEGPDGVTAGYYTGDFGEEEILVRFSTISEEGVWHHGDDAPTEEGTALFRYRGNSSRWFTKGNFRLRTVEEDDPLTARRLGLLGMKAGKEWALHGPFLDKTLMRNYMCMNLSAEVMGTWVPDTRFCEVILDGEYQGVYLLMETIGVEENRLDLREYEPGDPVLSYLVRIEPYTNPGKVLDNFSHYSYRMEPGRHLELLYPGVANQTRQVREYVQADYNEAERMLYSVEMLDGSGSWQQELDMGSFVNYYILMEFFGINDTFGASTYFYRDARGKLAIGPVWDYNNAFDNFLRPISSQEFLLSQRGWYAKLTQDREFVEQVISRYRQLRRGVLSEERLVAYEKEIEAWLGNAVDRNFSVWGWTFDPEQLSSRERQRPDPATGETLQEANPSSYKEAVAWMMDYIIGRGRWMDEHIESLRQYCHPSRFANQMLG